MSEKTAIVTGASSGIGTQIAKELSRRGYALVLVGRNEQKLSAVAKMLTTPATIIAADLSTKEGCQVVIDKTASLPVDVLINNAGFGLCGDLIDTDENAELEMIETNIRAVYLLTKHFVRRFHSQNNGYILNVASSAGFLPGVHMAVYYATKSFVLRLSQAVCSELRLKKSRVHVSVLCPGPVDTNFSDRAHVHFLVPGMDSRRVARIAVNGLFRRKMVIIPGFLMKAAHVIERLLPERILTASSAMMQTPTTKKGDLQ